MAGSAGAIRAGRAFVELFSDDSKLVRGLSSASAKLKAWGSSVSSFGRQLAIGSAMVLAPLVASAKAFSSFETTMANVATMLDEVDAHIGAFRVGIRKLSVELGESTETLGKGLYDILSASIDPAKAMDVLAVASRAARGGMTDTAVSANAITTVLNAYGLSADRAGDVSDWMFAIVKRGKTTYAELAPAIGKVATMANVAGVSLEELGAMLATLTRVGLDTDESVTAVTNVIKEFLMPSEEGAAIARDLGMEMNIATLQAEGLHGVFKRIASLPPETIAKLFPNIRGLRGVLPALQNLEGFSTDLGVMANRAGMADVAFQKMAGTLDFKMDQAWQAIKDLAVEIGEALDPVITALGETFTAMLGPVTEWIKEHRLLVTVFATTAAGTLVLGTALVVVGVGAKVAAVGLIGLKTTMIGLRMAAHALSVSFAFLAANPMVVTFAAVAAATVFLGLAFSKAGKSAEELTANSKSLIASQKERRSEMEQQFARLQELSDKENLNNQEMAEAQRLILLLERNYGALGIQIDKTTGKITGLSDAWKKANEGAAKLEVRELSKQIKDIDESEPNLIGRKEFLQERVTRTEKQGYFGPASAEAEAEELERLKDLIAQREALVLQKEALEEDLVGGASSLPPPPKGGGAGGSAGNDEAKKRLKDSLSYSLDLFHRQQQIRIGMIEDEHEREIELINDKYDHEIKAAKLAGKTIAGLEQTRQLEIKAAEKKHAQERADEAQKQQETEDAWLADYQDRVAEGEKGLQRDIERLQIEKTMKGQAREKALLALEEKRAIEEAKAAGLDPELVREKYRLMGDIAKASETKTSSVGTFNAMVVGRMGFAGGPAERTAKATEETAKLLRRRFSFTGETSSSTFGP